MSEMLNVLVLLCGLDYSQAEYKECIQKTKACYESRAKLIKNKTKTTQFTTAEKNIFYKCYSAGAVGSSKGLKR